MNLLSCTISVHTTNLRLSDQLSTLKTPLRSPHPKSKSGSPASPAPQVSSAKLRSSRTGERLRDCSEKTRKRRKGRPQPHRNAMRVVEHLGPKKTFLTTDTGSGPSQSNRLITTTSPRFTTSPRDHLHHKLELGLELEANP